MSGKNAPTPKSEAKAPTETLAEDGAKSAEKSPSQSAESHGPTDKPCPDKPCDKEDHYTPVDYGQACDMIAVGIKKFAEAGMGGADAGRLAFEVFRRVTGY